MRRLAIALTLTMLFVAAPAAYAERGVALVNNNLAYVDTANPGAFTFGVPITGLQPAENLLAVDYRPANGKLYGIGDSSRLYRINQVTGKATQVGDQFPVTLSGSRFDIDFSAVVDRIRVVSNADQNFRLNPDTGAQTMDTTLNPAADIAAIAYTSNFPGAPSATLFGIDYTNNALVRIGGDNGTPSPNLGAVTEIGALGVNPTLVSLDVASPSRRAFAVLDGSLYTLNTTTGAATHVGQVTPSLLPITSFAVQPMDPGLVFVNTDNNLIETTASSPAGGPATSINAGGEQILAIDFRPETGVLYGIGSGSHLFTLQRGSGQGTQVGSAPFTPGLGGAAGYGFDFLAGSDVAKLTTDLDVSERIDPDTGQVIDANPIAVGIQGDAPITPGSASVSAIAGQPNAPDTTFSGVYGIEDVANNLVRPQLNGTFIVVGPPLGVDFSSFDGLDIIDPELALATGLVSGGNNNLYQVDLASAETTPLGTIRAGAPNVRDLAIVPRGHFEHAAATETVTENAGQVSLVVNRTRGSDGRVTVEYETADDSAKAGEDYTATSGLLDFAPGELTKTINVPLIDDGTIEDAKAFTLKLSDPTNGATLAAGLAARRTVTVQSEDVAAPAPAGEQPAPPVDPGLGPAAPREPDSFIDGMLKAYRAKGARRLRKFSGGASDLDADLARVEVALVKLTGKAKGARVKTTCKALTSKGTFKSFKPARSVCKPKTFLRASSLAQWSFRLKKPLPKGSYVLYSRATDKGGRKETTFSLADQNRRAFKVK